MFIRFLLVLLGLSIACPFLGALLGLEFGRINFWQLHGVFFLIGLFFFPRITLLLSSVSSSGLLWWLAWFFVPRYLVAVLATFAFWYTNPILVVFSWLTAWGGESAEKFVVHRNIVRVKKMDHREKYDNVIDV